MIISGNNINITGTSNHMFGRGIWDKLPKYIFENFEIDRVKPGDLSQKSPEPNM